MRLLALLGPLASLAGAGGGPGWNLRDHIRLADVIVQSHRGAGELSPENSLEAFELAWSLGTIPEGDLRTTRDGVVVAFHDNDFRRILPNASPEQQKRGIQDLTWAEVALLDIGAWKGARFAGQRVPRLSAVFEILRRHPQRHLYVDVKNVDLERLARDAAEARVAAQLILASTDYDVIRRWKQLAPASFTLHWMGASEEQLTKRLAALRENRFASIDQLQIHVRWSGGALTPSASFLVETGRELRQRGILFQVLPLQSQDPTLYRLLMDLGVASFATDYPDVMMRTIRDYYAEPRDKPKP
jgi:glycerophosphoryl diester phosphodiesterase